MSTALLSAAAHGHLGDAVEAESQGRAALAILEQMASALPEAQRAAAWQREKETKRTFQIIRKTDL